MSYTPSSGNKSAFGDTVVVQSQQQLAIKGTYGVLDDVATFTATGGGATTNTDGEYVLTTGVSVGGYGVLWSRLPLVYDPGRAAEARATARFTTGVASSLQAVGFFTAVDGMFFGYNGTSFGVMHRHHGAYEIRTLTITAASGSSATATVTLNSVDYTAAVTNTTAAANAREIQAGLEAGAADALWYIEAVGDTVVFTSKNPAAAGGTYSLSVSAGTLAGTFAQDATGVAPTEEWTAQASWNVNTASWLDPTQGNLFKFEYAYLGYGPLKFSIFDPASRNWALMHVIDYPNSHTKPNFGNPALRVGWVSASLGSSTDLTVAGASGSASIDGQPRRGRVFSAQAVSTSVTTEVPLLTVQSRRHFGSRANNAVVQLDSITVGTDSAKGAIFRVYLDGTLTGPEFAYEDETQSVVLVDEAASAITGGRLVEAIVVGPSSGASVDLSTYNIAIAAGELLTVTCERSSGAAAEMDAAITWEERV